jgi:hypothetical protein
MYSIGKAIGKYYYDLSLPEKYRTYNMELFNVAEICL